MKNKVLAESLTMMTAAFGLVAALAWNEAIKSMIDQWVPKGKGVVPLFIYALAVTIIAVTINSRLVRIKQQIAEEEGEQK